MYRTLKLIFFLNSVGWLAACHITPETMVPTPIPPAQITPEREIISLYNSIIDRARFPNNYSDLVIELQDHPHIVPLFEYAIDHLPTKSVANHLLAQAYARNKYHTIEHEPDSAHAIISLCMTFEEQYPTLAASLSMYLYFYLSTSLRTTINNAIASQFSVGHFFSQLPADLRVVQFASVDEFSRTFVHIREMRPDSCFSLAFENGYAPFERYYARNRQPLFVDYASFCSTLKFAFQKRDLYVIDLMKRASENYQRSQPTFFKQALCDATIVERPLLLAAFLIGQYDMVIYLLKNGACPFQEITVQHYLHEMPDFEQDDPFQHATSIKNTKTTVLEQALSLIPCYTVGENSASDKAYRALITQASEVNTVLFVQIMRTNQEARNCIELLMPEEFLTQLDIREHHSCCICQ